MRRKMKKIEGKKKRKKIKVKNIFINEKNEEKGKMKKMINKPIELVS